GPLSHRLVGLSVVPARPAGLPASEGVGEALRAFVPGEAAPGADMDFTKLRNPDDLEPTRPRDGFGGLPGPAQVAGVDRVELDIREPLGEAPCLLAATMRPRARRGGI